MLVPERHNDFHDLDFRTLDKGLHLPTHHQLCSTPLLQGELNLRSICSAATRGLGGPLLQSSSWLAPQTSLHSEPCSASMSMRYFPCARDLSRSECTHQLSTRAELGQLNIMRESWRGVQECSGSTQSLHIGHLDAPHRFDFPLASQPPETRNHTITHFVGSQ